MKILYMLFGICNRKYVFFISVGRYGTGSYKTVLGIGNAPRT